MSRPIQNVFGPPSRLTAAEIKAVREVHNDLVAARKAKALLCDQLEIPKWYFGRVGRGEAGRKPRIEP